MAYEIHPVCDGYDVVTVAGVLHFTGEPSQDAIAALVTSLTAPVVPSVSVEAEDGVVL